jgi:hypothetical protein
MRRNLGMLVLLVITPLAQASVEFSYEAISKRYKAEQFSTSEVAEAKMHGECLVGLKELNFRSSEEFDPVEDWTNYRSLSLL